MVILLCHDTRKHIHIAAKIHLYTGIVGCCTGFSDGSYCKESACNSGDLSLISGSGRFPGERNGYTSSILAWRKPWTEQPGGLESMRLQSNFNFLFSY